MNFFDKTKLNENELKYKAEKEKLKEEIKPLIIEISEIKNENGESLENSFKFLL